MQVCFPRIIRISILLNPGVSPLLEELLNNAETEDRLRQVHLKRAVKVLFQEGADKFCVQPNAEATMCVQRAVTFIPLFKNSSLTLFLTHF